MPPVEHIKSFPSKCPFPSCRTKLHREWVLGVMPKFLGMVNAVIRCKSCERVFAFTMPVTAVEPFVASLPKDETFPFDITAGCPKEPISEKEVLTFDRRKPMTADETAAVIKAFAVLDEYDALGYYGHKDHADTDEDSDEIT